jgi:hypothetical protein
VSCMTPTRNGTATPYASFVAQPDMSGGH